MTGMGIESRETQGDQGRVSGEERRGKEKVEGRNKGRPKGSQGGINSR
jgi:hypothetical protein